MDLPVATTAKSFMILYARNDGFKADLAVMFLLRSRSRPNSSHRGRPSALFVGIRADLPAFAGMTWGASLDAGCSGRDVLRRVRNQAESQDPREHPP